MICLFAFAVFKLNKETFFWPSFPSAQRSSASLPSKKALDPYSKFPTLGIESTLPQHRLTNGEEAMPRQHQYPVWYFFYGNLADRSKLSKRLGIPEDEIEYHRASILGGLMNTWGGKYNALLDGDATSTTIEGNGFKVLSSDVEDILRGYETDRYEVVRYSMTLEGSGDPVPACVFKFLG